MTTKKSVKQVKKVRKVTDGPIKNKARTKERILDAVGKVLVKQGYTGLTIVHIAAEAGVDRKLIYLYYGSLKKLIETFIHSKEYWHFPGNEGISQFVGKGDNFNKDDVFTILQNQFNAFNLSKEYQKIIHWEISEKNKLMRKISDSREAIGESLLKVTDKHFKGSNIDIRAILALLIGGIYYINLHSQTNGGTCCGIDIKDQSEKNRIINAIKTVLDLSYGTLKKKK